MLDYCSKSYNYLLILFVFIWKGPSSSSSEFLHAIVNGSLSDPWIFNFTIFADDFQGSILHCFDSNNIQLGVLVPQGSNTDKRLVRLTYKNVKKDVPIKHFCGCESCESTKVNISLRYEISMVQISCNNHTPESLLLSNIKDKNIEYPFPMNLVNTTERILIMMGNIGPYIGQGNVRVTPQKEQLNACLYSFYYNNARIAFIGNTTKVRPSCPKKCHSDSCHGGLCKEVTPYNLTCDCSSTALNGGYCNRSMIAYDPRGNNSFIKVNHVDQTYMKMTWKQLLYKHYCLMEIDTKYGGSVTISINNNNLLINSDIFSNIINKDGINFIFVYFLHNHFFVKSVTNITKKELIINENTQINIGFSSRYKNCEIFEGAYDLDYNTSQWQQIIQRRTETTVGSTIVDSNTTTIKVPTTINGGSQSYSLSIIQIPIIVILSGGVLILIYQKCKRTHTIKEIRSIELGNVYQSPPTYSALDYVDIDDPSNNTLDIYDYVPMNRRSDMGLLPDLPPRRDLDREIKDPHYLTDIYDYLPMTIRHDFDRLKEVI